MKSQTIKMATALSVLFLPLGFVDKTEYDRVVEEKAFLETKTEYLEQKVEELKEENTKLKKDLDTIKTNR